jgi:pyridoxal biosynthesis lyase PdxS
MRVRAASLRCSGRVITDVTDADGPVRRRGGAVAVMALGGSGRHPRRGRRHRWPIDRSRDPGVGDHPVMAKAYRSLCRANLGARGRLHRRSEVLTPADRPSHRQVGSPSRLRCKFNIGEPWRIAKARRDDPTKGEAGTGDIRTPSRTCARSGKVIRRLGAGSDDCTARRRTSRLRSSSCAGSRSTGVCPS